MRYPDFFIVGAAKAGTTALWKSLGSHPAIFMTSAIENKELSYFCNDYGLKDSADYLTNFREASGNQLIGEVCHTYLTSPESAEWIKEVVPGAKIIIILRNPATRAYSLYQWMVMEGYEPISSFEEALQLEQKRLSDKHLKSTCKTYYRNHFYYHTGLYAEQVNRYMEMFGESNTLILIYEDFRKNPDTVLNQIYAFLGVRSMVSCHSCAQVVNESKAVFSPFLQYFLKHRAVSILKKLHIPKTQSKKMVRCLMQWNILSKRNKINPDTYRALLARYDDDIRKLQTLIGRDLKSVWN